MLKQKMMCEPEEKEESKMIAKKDFKIVQNEYEKEIKKGDDCSGVPRRFHQNLKTEGVID